ncbi:MAG: hypothetical protein PHY88_05925 [Candidatus Omnitrophica bacterium]|nr:hypothetical protein [Candidatus Omnitrophota bacterium]
MKKKKIVVLTVSALIIIAIAWAAIFILRGTAATGLAGKILLQAGRPLRFAGYTVLVDRVEGNKLYGIKVSSQNKTLEAKSGDYTYIPERNAIRFTLVDGVAEDHDPDIHQKFNKLTFQQTIFTLKLESKDK